MVVEEKTVQNSKAIEVQKQRISETRTLKETTKNIERLKECNLLSEEEEKTMKEIVNKAAIKYLTS